MTPEEKNPKKTDGMRKKIDKLLLGVVVGGAVGSILGITLAPKSGKETRKIIGEKGRETWDHIAEIIEEKSRKIEARFEKKKKKTIWHRLNEIFSQKNKQVSKQPRRQGIKFWNYTFRNNK